MHQELQHSPCMMSLIAPLNASAILCVFLWTWPPPKEPTENFGVNYCLLISTETSQSIKETRLRITLPLRLSKLCRAFGIKFSNSNITARPLSSWGGDISSSWIVHTFNCSLKKYSFCMVNTIYCRVNENKAKFSVFKIFFYYFVLQTRFFDSLNVVVVVVLFFFSVTLFFLTVSKRGYLSAELQTWHVWMSLPTWVHWKILWKR